MLIEHCMRLSLQVQTVHGEAGQAAADLTKCLTQ